MSAPTGAQYAVQIAVQTLRDRCKSLQQRVVILEEENINLRIQCSRYEDKDSSLSEIDRLRSQITELSEQKEQLNNKIKMVTGENQDLWFKLGKLTRVNKSLGNQLTQINNTITQHQTSADNTVKTPTNLIRSKTFTKDELQTKILQKNLEENDKISLELEDISLKLSDSFSKQKKELDMLCSEIAEIQCSEGICENYGFSFDDDLEDDFIDEFKIFFDDMKALKDEVLQQREALRKSVKNVENLKEKLKSAYNTKLKNKEVFHQSTTTSDLVKNHTVDQGTMPIDSVPISERSPSKSSSPSKVPDKICPICTKLFKKDVDFLIFQQHVEDHFTHDTDSYEIV